MSARTYGLAVDDLDRFADIPEAAARLSINDQTAWRWIREGCFPVPVRRVGNKQVVSLRLLVAFINDTDSAVAS